MDELRQVFVQESGEQLDALETLLLELETRPGDEATLNGIFRAAHTVKGAAGMVEASAVEAFAHVVENVLDRLRNHEFGITPDLAALLLACTDHLRALIAREAGEAVADGLAADGDALLARLGAVGAGGTAPDAPAASPAELAPGDVHRMPSSAGAINRCWHLSLRFGPDVLRQGMDPENFLRYLESLGTIVQLETVLDGLPAADEMDPECCYLGFEIMLDSNADKPAIEEVFSFVRDDCRLAILPPHSRIADYVQLIEALPEDTLRLGEMLVRVGALTADELADGLRAQQQGAVAAAGPDEPPADAPAAPPPIGEILVAQNVVQPELVAAAVAKQGEVSEKKAHEAKLIRVPADKLDHLINLVGELVIAGASTSVLAQRRRDGELIESASLLTRLVEEIRDASLQLRTVEIGETFNRFHRLVRDACRDLHKEVELVITGGDTELDKSIVEKIGDPLMHLVRNSLDHGIETPDGRAAAGKPARGRLELNAYHDSGNVVIEVADDGAGLNRERILAKAVERGLVEADAHLSDREVLDLIFAPGLSTKDEVTNLSGRGVGMDVVRRNLQALRGTIAVASEPGRGTRFTLRLPLTLAIIDGFLVFSANRPYVIPLDAVVECVERPAMEHGRHYFNLRGQVLPTVRLRESFALPGDAPARESVVVVQSGGERAGIVVDRLAGELQAVIKPLGAIFRHLHGIGGSTILGSGEVALILDVSALIKNAGSAEARLLGGA